MRNPNQPRWYPARVFSALVLFASLAVLFSPPTRAEGWSGIEPLKSRRIDVERVLGKPLNEPQGNESTLHFNVAGGAVTVSFVDARFVANKKLRPELEGTVLQIILQHERSSDTPESMSLDKKREFDRQDERDITVYRNLKGGVTYTFVASKLKTTRYSASADQLVRARK
jgi:hypothetical protein